MVECPRMYPVSPEPKETDLPSPPRRLRPATRRCRSPAFGAVHLRPAEDPDLDAYLVGAVVRQLDAGGGPRRDELELNRRNLERGRRQWLRADRCQQRCADQRKPLRRFHQTQFPERTRE